VDLIINFETQAETPKSTIMKQTANIIARCPYLLSLKLYCVGRAGKSKGYMIKMISETSKTDEKKVGIWTLH
jgi:hypothetical protein